MEQRFILLFQKYVTRTGSLSDTEAFWLMVQDSRYNHLLTKLIDEHYASFEDVDDTLKSEAEDRILSQVFSSDGSTTPVDPPVIPLYRKWSRLVVASTVAAILFGGLFYYNQQLSDQAPQTAQSNDIAPGKPGATLTLANGKKIKLSDVANGEIAQEAGISVSKTSDGQLVYEIKDSKGDSNQLNTLSTQKGETYVLTLPDKSRVWLNSASSLTYYARLNENGRRKVKLTGEAYFQVAKDKQHPFIVESKGQEVEVLGTHFNVNAYADEKAIKTTLLEGSVKVVSDKREILVLKPGQQSVLLEEKIKVREANLEEAVAWKNGYFRFNDENIESVMRKVARWYNVEVVFDTDIPTEGLFGKVSRSKNISQVLKVLEATSLVHFKVEGRRVLVTK